MNHILKCHEIIGINFVRGKNCYLYDDQGRRYTDLESGIWSTVLGHNHPRINRVMKSQIDKVIHLGTRYPNSLSEEAAREVLDIVGIDHGKCVFLSSGSEAVEFGTQIARRVTGNRKFLTFSNSYLAAYGSAGKKSTDEWCLIDWTDDDSTDDDNRLKGIPFKDLGGFVFEPGGSGSGFVKFPPKRLVQDIVYKIRQEGGLVIANEVTAGMGRTGKWFGFQHYDIQPDIISLGKGLGNGYPVSAIVMNIGIAENLEKNEFHYAQSHQNDPLGCTVAKEVITILREEHLIQKGNHTGESFLEELKHLQEKYDVVKEARGRGMLLALELRPHDKISATSVYQALLEKGFLVGYYPAGNILRFDPALTIEEANISSLIDCLDLIFKTALSKV
ncbi:MAG: aspartate aminotransferase family protein [Anaerolineales bacterium]|nr:aspartate aminotransferase family protein [Anaerolineales bacterium]